MVKNTSQLLLAVTLAASASGCRARARVVAPPPPTARVEVSAGAEPQVVQPAQPTVVAPAQPTVVAPAPHPTVVAPAPHPTVVAPAPHPTVVAPAAQATLTMPSFQAHVQLGTGVTAREMACHPNAAESCDGIDNNCNGAIDEGCGYATGSLQITLAWAGGADLDLYVTDPTRERVSYSHRRSRSGGNLDQDARGACRPDQRVSTVENVYWDQTSPPPSGQYQIDVHYFSDCNAAAMTQATVSVAAGGRTIGAYDIALQPRGRQTVAYVQIP